MNRIKKRLRICNILVVISLVLSSCSIDESITTQVESATDSQAEKLEEVEVPEVEEVDKTELYRDRINEILNRENLGIDLRYRESHVTGRYPQSKVYNIDFDNSLAICVSSKSAEITGISFHYVSGSQEEGWYVSSGLENMDNKPYEIVEDENGELCVLHYNTTKKVYRIEESDVWGKAETYLRKLAADSEWVKRSFVEYDAVESQYTEMHLDEASIVAGNKRLLSFFYDIYSAIGMERSEFQETCEKGQDKLYFFHDDGKGTSLCDTVCAVKPLKISSYNGTPICYSEYINLIYEKPKNGFYNLEKIQYFQGSNKVYYIECAHYRDPFIFRIRHVADDTTPMFYECENWFSDLQDAYEHLYNVDYESTGGKYYYYKNEKPMPPDNCEDQDWLYWPIEAFVTYFNENTDKPVAKNSVLIKDTSGDRKYKQFGYEKAIVTGCLTDDVVMEMELSGVEANHTITVTVYTDNEDIVCDRLRSIIKAIDDSIKDEEIDDSIESMAFGIKNWIHGISYMYNSEELTVTADIRSFYHDYIEFW